MSYSFECKLNNCLEEALSTLTAFVGDMRFTKSEDNSVAAMAVGHGLYWAKGHGGKAVFGKVDKLHNDRIVGIWAATCQGKSVIYSTGWDKQLIVTNTDDGEVLYRRVMEKKPCSLWITNVDNIGTVVLVGQLNGEVTAFPAEDVCSKERKLLGHTGSMIMDMEVAPSGKYIVTADKDAKIRVSKFPASELIQAYCLGHTEFLNRILILRSEPRLLISGGADGTLRLWDWEAGSELHSTNFENFTEPNEDNADLSYAQRITIVKKIVHSPKHGLVAVCLTDRHAVLVYVVKDDRICSLGTINLNQRPDEMWFSGDDDLELSVASTESISQLKLQRDTDTIKVVSQKEVSFLRALSQSINASDEGSGGIGPLSENLALEKEPPIHSVVLQEHVEWKYAPRRTQTYQSEKKRKLR